MVFSAFSVFSEFFNYIDILNSRPRKCDRIESVLFPFVFFDPFICIVYSCELQSRLINTVIVR